MQWPVLSTILSNNFVRGAVSGLGVVNLFAGFAELASLLNVRDAHELSLHDDPR
jgi:hypothetical protein